MIIADRQIIWRKFFFGGVLLTIWFACALATYLLDLPSDWLGVLAIGFGLGWFVQTFGVGLPSHHNRLWARFVGTELYLKWNSDRNKVNSITGYLSKSKIEHILFFGANMVSRGDWETMAKSAPAISSIVFEKHSDAIMFKLKFGDMLQ